MKQRETIAASIHSDIVKDVKQLAKDNSLSVSRMMEIMLKDWISDNGSQQKIKDKAR